MPSDSKGLSRAQEHMSIINTPCKHSEVIIFGLIEFVCFSHFQGSYLNIAELERKCRGENLCLCCVGKFWGAL